MIIDGKKIAEDIYSEIKRKLSRQTRPLRLVVFTADPQFQTQKFISVKQKKAEMLDIEMEIAELSPDIDTAACVTAIRAASADADGIIVQLPFPPHVDRGAVIAAIPKNKDIDAFNIEDDAILPPVVGAIEAIVKRHAVTLTEKKCVVIGDGRLVGAPVVSWLQKKQAQVTQLTKESGDITAHTKNADLIVLGAGVPKLLRPEMIREGVAIFDAGTSETAGRLVGDADPACAEKASIFTPVPGGIGPITVAVLFRNLVTLSEKT